MIRPAKKELSSDVDAAAIAVTHEIFWAFGPWNFAFWSIASVGRDDCDYFLKETPTGLPKGYPA